MKDDAKKCRPVYFPPAKKQRTPPNRCYCCGKIVGEQFYGYSHDRLEKGPFVCARCERKNAEAERV